MHGNKYKRLSMVRQRYHLLPSKDVDDQRILESDCPNVTPGNNQPSLVVLNATFP